MEMAVLMEWRDELGPWDRDRTLTIRMVRPGRLGGLIKLINSTQIGTATVVKITQPYEKKEYVDAEIAYVTKLHIE